MVWCCLLWFGLPVLAIVASVISMRRRPYDEHPLQALIIVLSVIMLLMIAITAVVYPLGVGSKMAAFQSVQQTIDDAREEADDWERAALQQEVVEWNAWLRRTQWWARKPVFDIFWPDEVLELDPIGYRCKDDYWAEEMITS